MWEGEDRTVADWKWVVLHFLPGKRILWSDAKGRRVDKNGDGEVDEDKKRACRPVSGDWLF
jgi:hypothetical protein